LLLAKRGKLLNWNSIWVRGELMEKKFAEVKKESLATAEKIFDGSNR